MMRRVVAVGVMALSLWAARSAWAPATATGQSGALQGEWRAYGGDLASTDLRGSALRGQVVGGRHNSRSMPVLAFASRMICPVCMLKCSTT
jgi:hypothetical protein